MDRVVVRLLGQVTRAAVQRWIAEGHVLIDGRPCRPRDLVGPGSCIEVERALPPPSGAVPDSSVEFGVLYEDAHLIVVDKPAGLVVHPARGHRSGTLVNGLLARPGFSRAPADPLDLDGQERPGVVHRLDRGTSGILVVAKDERTREGLKQQLALHTVERAYLAIVVGVPESGTIQTLYGRHPHSRLKFCSRVERGRPATTLVEVREVLAGGAAAVVQCRLRTGRTHQIRVHLSEQSAAPVLGDPLYGREPQSGLLAAVAQELGRQALHAERLGFEHPITKQWHRFVSPLPADMQRALVQLRAGRE